MAGLFAGRAPESGYEITRTAAGFEARTVTGNGDKTIPVEWAFGAGGHAVTFVSQLDEDQYLEHRFTLYAQSVRWT